MKTFPSSFSKYNDFDNRTKAIYSILWYIIDDVPSDNPLIYPIINVYHKHILDLCSPVEVELYHAHSKDKKIPKNNFMSTADWEGSNFYAKHLQDYEIREVATEYVYSALAVKNFITQLEVKEIMLKYMKKSFEKEHVIHRLSQENEHIIFFEKKDSQHILKPSLCNDYNFF